MKQTCELCGGELKYCGDLAAPGYGQHWECAKCGEAYHVTGFGCNRFANLEPEDVELDPSDCI